MKESGRKEEEDKVHRDRRECIGIEERESSGEGEKKALGAACDAMAL